jgi:hypothetical protein
MRHPRRNLLFIAGCLCLLLCQSVWAQEGDAELEKVHNGDRLVDIFPVMDDDTSSKALKFQEDKYYVYRTHYGNQFYLKEEL